ncbi:MAG: FtsX-like permease family protein [Gemmatimonas sp.]|nr:FtsX-like permease family protein [Gemmatimonas sp.]
MKRFLESLPQLFPRKFREEFAAEIAEVIGTDYERSRRRGRFHAGWFAFRTTVDVLMAAIGERINPTWVDQRAEINARRWNMGGQLDNWRRDLAFASRSLFRTPVFTLISVLTLTLAIGANTAIFSVVNTVLLDPLAFPESDRLVSIRGIAPGSDLSEEFGVATEFYVQYRENATALEDLGLYMEGEMTVRADDRVERLPVSTASPSLFSTLRVRPVIGRLPTEQDEDAQVVVLSHWLWTNWFGRDPGVIGQPIEVASGPRTVVGVMGPEFGFPHERTSLWMHDLPSEPIRPGGFGFNLVGRLAPEADHAALSTQLAALARRLPERFGGSVEYTRIIEQHRPVVRSLEEELVGDIATPLWILLGTVAIVLLIACANVANLLIVRAEGRRRDLAVRRALGANRADLIRAQMIEALLVAAAGGVGGVLLALAGVPLLVRAAPETIPRLGSAGLDLAALVFTAGVVLLAALASGLLPAIRFSKPAFEGTLRSGRQTDARATHFTRNALVVAQSAAALVLLVGSGLLIQSFIALNQVDSGYETEDIFTFKMAPDLRAHDVSDGSSLARFHYTFMDRLAELPAVESVGLVYTLPLDEGAESTRIATEHTEATGALEPLVRMTFAGGDYFRTMGIELLGGSDFEQSAAPTDDPKAIVSLRAANLFWPGENPIGLRFRRTGPDSTSWITVSGVVEDVILDDLRQEEPEPLVYLPMVGHTEQSWGVFNPTYVVKSSRAGSLAPEVRELIREIAPEAPTYHIFTMSALVARSVARLTFTMLTLGIAAGIAIILGAVGLYGVLSYVVSQRTQEIGIRMALGARAGELRRMIVAQGSRVTLLGVLIGAIAAVALTRVLESLLFGVAAVHVPTFAITAGLMLGVALLASYLPARRASSVDPVQALRSQ